MFSDFFRRFFFSPKKLGHLFRSQISSRFQKSHLENCRRKLKPSFCPYTILYHIFFPEFQMNPMIWGPHLVTCSDLISVVWSEALGFSLGISCKHAKRLFRIWWGGAHRPGRQIRDFSEIRFTFGARWAGRTQKFRL